MTIGCSLRGQAALVLISLIHGFVFIYLGTTGPLVGGDTSSYINSATIRTPLYPLFLKVVGLGAPDRHMSTIIIVQLALGWGVGVYFLSLLKKVFTLNWYCLALLSLPIFHPYYFEKIKAGNFILSEGLAYPLFILYVSLWLNFCRSTGTKIWVAINLIMALLILTRPQFLFLIPFHFCVSAVAFYFNKRNGLKFLFIFLSLCFFTHLSEKSWLFMNTGKFSTISFTGIQLIALPIYLGLDSSDEKTDLDDLNILAQIRLEAKSRHLLLTDRTRKTRIPDHYFQIYNELVHSVVSKISVSALKKAQSLSDLEAKTQGNKLLIDLSMDMIQTHPVLYLRMLTFFMIHKFGSMSFFVFILLLTLTFLIITLKSSHFSNIFMLGILTMSWLNLFLIVLVEPMLKRYTMYSDGLFMIALILVLVRLSVQLGLEIHSQQIEKGLSR